jgi:hypothetical protein
VAFEDVGMVEFLECINLAIEHALFRLALDGSDVNHFYCHFFLGLVIRATVDDRAEPSSNDVLEAIGVVLDFFPEVVASVLWI